MDSRIAIVNKVVLLLVIESVAVLVSSDSR